MIILDKMTANVRLIYEDSVVVLITANFSSGINKTGLFRVRLLVNDNLQFIKY